jgi:hypothetical protein
VFQQVQFLVFFTFILVLYEPLFQYVLTMSVSLELLTQILMKVEISSSQEEEILTTIKDSNTPPETIECSTSEDSHASDDEQSIEQKIEEDEEELEQNLSEEKCAYESIIEKWFQVSTRLVKFHFYLVSFTL